MYSPDVKKAFVQKGDVVQVMDNLPEWAGTLLVVSEVKPFGVQAGMKIPFQGVTFIRLKWEEFELIGKSYFWFGEGEEAIDTTRAQES